MRKFCRRYSAVGLIVLIVFFAVLPLQVAADVPEHTQRVVRVGYIPFDHMIKYDVNRGYYGYGVTYLNELAKKTGWTYEFVEVTESERMEKLVNGEIDLLCSIHKNCEEKDELLFCDNPAGLEYGMLATLKSNNHIFFDDYENITGKKIGINVNSDLEFALERYAKEKGITYQPVYFENLKDMQMALNRMSIDIMLVSSLRDLSNVKYVGKTYSIEEYFTTSKNNPELMEELNRAEHELKRERPFYNSALYESYNGKPSEKLLGITREEYEVIARKEPIRVACDGKSYPIEYKDEKSGEYAGVYADALARISKQSGLKFEYIILDDYSKAWEMVKNGEADMIAGSYGNNVWK